MWVRFWIKSNRGTDTGAYEWLPDDEFEKDDEEAIKAELEEWCRNFGAWDHSDNIVDYGYEIKDPPLEVLKSKLADYQARIDGLHQMERMVAESVGHEELVARVRQEWDSRESHLNQVVQTASKEHAADLMKMHTERRRLSEKYAAEGIEVETSVSSAPRVNKIKLSFADAEWGDLLNKHGRLLKICCARVSRIRTILNSALREGAWITASELWEAAHLIQQEEDCDEFPVGHPLLRLVQLWETVAEDADPTFRTIPRDLDDPEDALAVVYSCAGVISWKNAVGRRAKDEQKEYERKLTVNFTLSQLWPAIKTVYEKFKELGFKPLKGWAVCCGDEVLDSRSGFCIFQRQDPAREVLNRANAAAHTEWERAKRRRLVEIENGEYEEGGRYEGEPVPPEPEKEIYVLRPVKVSLDKGIEFTDTGRKR